MSKTRITAVVTGVVAAGLLVWLTVAQWEQANRVATIASAVGTVAAAGIAIWAGLRTPPHGTPANPASGGIRVQRTGRARTGQRGAAITGVRSTGAVPPGGVEVDRSGSARTDGDGDAVTGVDLGKALMGLFRRRAQTDSQPRTADGAVAEPAMTAAPDPSTAPEAVPGSSDLAMASRTGKATGGDHSTVITGVQQNTVNVHVNAPIRQPPDTVRVGVPPMLADHYQPRLAVTTQLDRAVSAGGTAILTQILSGTGGVGKTQLAAQYAAARWPDPDLRLGIWVSARSRDGIVGVYAQAAVELLGADPTDQRQAANQLLTWLATTDCRWLILLDDLQRPEDLRHLWPPASPQGRVVVTTRRRDPSLARTDRPLIDVGVFTPDEAHDYLTAKLAGHPQLVDGLGGLAGDLGYLPLALAQAVAYLTNRGLTCAQYRRRLGDERHTLSQVLPTHGELPDDHDHTVAATFALSIRLADEIEPAGLAGPVMLLASLLDPAGIPPTVFGTDAVWAYLSEMVDRPVSADDLDEVLGVVHRLSLLTLDLADPVRGVQVHALVQRATREATQYCPDEIGDAARAAADALMQVWPQIERDTELAQVLRANTQILHAVAERGLWTPNGHAVLFRAGHSLGEAGLVGSAVTYFGWLNDLTQANLGPDHPGTHLTRGSLAAWRGEAGDTTGAANAYADLLTDQLRILGPDHPNTLTTRNNLA